MVKWRNIIAPYNVNFKMTEIAIKLCIEYVTIKRVISKYNRLGEVIRKQESGCQKYFQRLMI